MTTRRERGARTLAGQPVDRAVAGPLAVHYCAGLAGVSLRDYTLNPRCLADSVIRYYERFRPDAGVLPPAARPWRTPRAPGGRHRADPAAQSCGAGPLSAHARRIALRQGGDRQGGL